MTENITKLTRKRFLFSFSMNNMLISIVFFFQAEDCIRYATVTGVQTCALPIFIAATWYLASLSVFAIFAVGSFLMVVALTAFELLIQFLQAFIFTTLTATYIARSIEPEH